MLEPPAHPGLPGKLVCWNLKGGRVTLPYVDPAQSAGYFAGSREARGLSGACLATPLLGRKLQQLAEQLWLGVLSDAGRKTQGEIVTYEARAPFLRNKAKLS